MVSVAQVPGFSYYCAVSPLDAAGDSRRQEQSVVERRIP
jgi:hypothetical protein